MTLEPYALANARSHAQDAVGAQIALPRSQRLWSAPESTEQYFCGKRPVIQDTSRLFGAADLTFFQGIALFSIAHNDTALHDPHAAPERFRWRNRIDINRNVFVGRSMGLEGRRVMDGNDFFEFRGSITPFPAAGSLGRFNFLRRAPQDDQSFPLIESVKELLDQHKIRAARRALEVGLIHDPLNLQAAKLLRAISPGRVSPTGKASSSRERETVWIKRHGQKYRGKWIALDEDKLIAFADTLKELLAILDAGSDQKEPPFIVHLVSEKTPIC